MVVLGLVWLVGVTIGLVWVAFSQSTVPPSAIDVDEDPSALLVERIQERTRAVQRKLLRIPLLSAAYVIIAPYMGVLVGLAGPQVRLVFQWVNGLIPALRKAQGFYIVMFWVNKLKEARLLTRAGNALRVAGKRALGSLKSVVRP